MIIVCVGPDCAGKSSMIDALVEREGYEPFKMSPPFSELDLLKALDVLEGQLAIEDNIVWDRIPLLDDIIYSRAMEGRPSFYEVNGLMPRITRALKKCLIVYIEADTNVLLLRAQMREGGEDKYLDTKLTKKALERIRDTYILTFAEYDLLDNVEKMDTTYMDQEFAIDVFCRAMASRKSDPKVKRVAHIVPKASLYLTANNQYHMCLAQLAKEDRVYADFFKQRAMEGKYVLLDNGAAEATTTSIEDLLMLASSIGASEVILPDVLGDKEKTLELTDKAYEYWKTVQHVVGIMVVPQGKDLKEWKECAKMMVQRYPGADFGIPKVLAKVDPFGRYDAIEYLSGEMDMAAHEGEIHLLGCNEQPMVVKTIFDKFERVRGMDSSFAYLCTKAATPISHAYIKRPEDTEIGFLTDPDLGTSLAANLQAFDIQLVNNENGLHYTWRSLYV